MGECNSLALLLTPGAKHPSFCRVTFAGAFVLGFSVASIPGPTIVLITTETLTKGARAGIAAMAAPLLLDAFLMLPLGLALQGLLVSPAAATGLGLIGGCFLGWLGLNSIRSARPALAGHARQENSPLPDRDMPSFLKGMLTHLSSPYPYLYWATVGAPLVRQGFARAGVPGAVFFPLGFWLGASAFTLLTIFVAAQGKRLLPARFEPWLHIASGLLLIGCGIALAARTWTQ
ncbi:MAG TPA: LysE family translocator [Candidatus Acidoferrales bacterium]|nr:LysE family translocator [Candidatus Acidoferrales bacterium]